MLEEEDEETGAQRGTGVEQLRASIRKLGMDREGDIAQGILDRVDTNRDGRISTSEWEAASRRVYEEDWDEVSQAIAALDINIAEFDDVIRYAFTKFDENGDGKISFDEFSVACKTIGLKVDPSQYSKVFKVLARGKEFIVPEELDNQAWQSFGRGFDTALMEQYRGKGFARAQFVLDEVGYQWDRAERLPFLERLGHAVATFWNQAEGLTDLFEFLLDLVGIGLALGSISEELKCLPDCEEQLDVSNLIPLVFLLRKSLSDALKEISDNSVQDLDQDTAMAFATVFKPAGVKLTGFMKLQSQGATWQNVPRGEVVPYATAASGTSLQLIVRGSARLVCQGNMTGLTETVAVLKAGSFIGGAKFLGAGDGLLSGRGRNALVADDDVLLLVWTNTTRLKSFLQVYDTLRAQFTFAIVRSIEASTSQVMTRSKKFATELPNLFRNFEMRLASTLKADRATIWIHSSANESLWTWFVSEKGKATYVSVPDSAGLVGVAFVEKAGLNIPDCYEDDRFNAEVDKKTGYHTQSMLCVPVFDEPRKLDRVIGVVQLINKIPDGAPPRERYSSFTDADERRVFDIRWALRFMMKELSSRRGVRGTLAA